MLQAVSIGSIGELPVALACVTKNGLSTSCAAGSVVTVDGGQAAR